VSLSPLTLLPVLPLRWQRRAVHHRALIHCRVSSLSIFAARRRPHRHWRQRRSSTRPLLSPRRNPVRLPRHSTPPPPSHRPPHQPPRQHQLCRVRHRALLSARRYTTHIHGDASRRRAVSASTVTSLSRHPNERSRIVLLGSCALRVRVLPRRSRLCLQVPLPLEQACANRDAVARVLYAKLCACDVLACGVFACSKPTPTSSHICRRSHQRCARRWRSRRS
jgi:hypothetical protein